MIDRFRQENPELAHWLDVMCDTMARARRLIPREEMVWGLIGLVHATAKSNGMTDAEFADLLKMHAKRVLRREQEIGNRRLQ